MSINNDEIINIVISSNNPVKINAVKFVFNNVNFMIIIMIVIISLI